MNQEQVNKIKERIRKQQLKQDNMFGNYNLGMKKSTSVRYSMNKRWSVNDLPKVKQNIL